MSSNISANRVINKRIDAMLTSHGVMVTNQRRIIANSLFSRNQHVTAEQLYDQIKQSGHKVSKATIYNTLGLFTDKGLVRMIFIDAASSFYDSNISHHHHFYNVDSRELADVELDLPPDSLVSNLPPGTELETVDLVFRIRNKRQ